MWAANKSMNWIVDHILCMNKKLLLQFLFSCWKFFFFSLSLFSSRFMCVIGVAVAQFLIFAIGVHAVCVSAVFISSLGRVLYLLAGGFVVFQAILHPGKLLSSSSILNGAKTKMQKSGSTYAVVHTFPCTRPFEIVKIGFFFAMKCGDCCSHWNS